MTMPINYARVMPAAQVRFRTRFTSLMTTAADAIAAVVLRAADEDGIVPVEDAGRVSGEALVILDRVFLGDGGREVVRPDGMPRSPYARILLEEIGRATYEIVLAHEAYLKRVLPGDVRFWMRQTAPVLEMAPHHQVIRELTAAQVRERFPLLTDEDVRKVVDLRIFDPNPLAEYEAPHEWVDPRGYRLSDRIWRVDQRTRDKLDAMLVDAIAEGRGSTEIAKLAQQFLIPGRNKIRTNKPYGTDASYDAMRLARTEIAAASNNAALISAQQNPYAETIEIVRSTNGDLTCPICPQHATIGIDGGRLRDAYPVETPPADIAPFHPHCMCHIRPVAAQSVEQVETDLRALLQQSRETNLVPYVNPTDAESFTQILLGEILWNITKQALPVQPRLL